MSLRFWRLPLTFDAVAMRAELTLLQPSDWPSHFNTDYHDGGWSGVALVSDDGDTARLYAEVAAGATGIATPLLARCPAMRAAIAELPGAVQSARLLRLAAGSVIREHRDYGLGLGEGAIRLHIPVVSHPDVEFYLDGVRVPMREGECWYLDFGLPHRVQNNSPRERIHLVVDCVVDDQLRAMLPTVAESEQQMQLLSTGEGESSQQRFERFRAQVLNDLQLQAELCTCEDLGTFVDLVRRAGSARGHHFTSEDVRAAHNAGRRAWFERNVF